MAVGFASGAIPVTAAQPHGKPNEPWELRFSRFVDEGGEAGAHRLSRGAGITIAHIDTGYTLHPELMHGNNVLTGDAKTFTDPAPSVPAFFSIVEYLQQSLNVAGGVNIAVSRNAVQVRAGASVWVKFPNDGLDPLVGDISTVRFPSHGTSTASLFMSAVGAPPPTTPPYPSPAQAAEGFPVKTIVGSAPESQYLPIRVADTVAIDPIVANNMATAINYLAQKAQSEPSIGVISISMGWLGGPMHQNYDALAKAIRRATNAGLVVCAAAGQVKFALHDLFDTWADTAEGLAGRAQQGNAAAQEAARVLRVAGMVADFTGLALGSNYPTVQALCDEVERLAVAGGQSADQIAIYLSYIEAVLDAEARAARKVGWPMSPGNYIDTICCAACDYQGNRMHDGMYGREVDITAPGAETYSAKSVLNDQGKIEYVVQRSSGTSYATAITAGACAVWQAHHGRQNLINRFGRPLIAYAFRWALANSAAQQTVTGAQTPWDGARRGYGMLDAAALLQVQLPADKAALITALHTERLIGDATRARLRKISGLS